MAATAAHNGESYLAFVIQGLAGKSYASVASSGGATWTKDEDNNNNSAHCLGFVDNVGGNHALTDLPGIVVTFTSAPPAGYAVLVGLGDASGTLNHGHLSNDGNGDNPNATLTYFGPGIGQALITLIVIDNGGTLNAWNESWVELSHGTTAAGQNWYLGCKFPSTGDGGGGGDDDRTFSVALTGTNIHWTLTHFVFDSPGAGKDPYVIDEGVATAAGNDLSFTADIHGNFPVAPANTVLPAVTGTAKSGQTLSCSTGTWTGNPTPTYAYQWKAGGVSIGGATASTFLLTDTQHGSTITCAVTATNSEGNATATSSATSAVVYATPANSVLPVVTGKVIVNQTLSCTTGTWTGGGIAYTYQWVRGAATNIGGATSATYRATTADVGKTLKCTVTATSDGGVTAATSAATAAIKSNSKPWMLSVYNRD